MIEGFLHFIELTPTVSQPTLDVLKRMATLRNAVGQTFLNLAIQGHGIHSRFLGRFVRRIACAFFIHRICTSFVDGMPLSSATSPRPHRAGPTHIENQYSQ
jgi:hypothetical protein